MRKTVRFLQIKFHRFCSRSTDVFISNSFYSSLRINYFNWFRAFSFWDFFIQTYLRFVFTLTLSVSLSLQLTHIQTHTLSYKHSQTRTHSLLLFSSWIQSLSPSLTQSLSRIHLQTRSFPLLLVSKTKLTHPHTLTIEHPHTACTHTHAHPHTCTRTSTLASSIDNSARSFRGMAGLHISLNGTLHISESWLHTLQTFSPRPKIYLFLGLLNRRMFRKFLLLFQNFRPNKAPLVSLETLRVLFLHYRMRSCAIVETK